MMGTNSVPILVLAVLSAAVVAAPAAVAGGYRSADAVLAAAATPSSSSPSGPEKQLFAGSTGGLRSSEFGEPTPVASPAAGSTEGFDWGDAALGAGVALGLVALGGAGLAIRRRMALSPAAPTS